MENVFGVIVSRYKKIVAKKASVCFRELYLDKKQLDEWDRKHFCSLDEMVDRMFVSYLAHAYQDGVSAGKKLSDKNSMNEIDAVEFAIKELKKRKDELKVKVANEVS